MVRTKYFHPLVRTLGMAAVISYLLAGWASTERCLADSQSATAPSTNAAPPSADAPKTAKKVSTRKQLTGAELYSMHCNRCHPERSPTERTAAQWKTIALHMQVRANIPPSQIKLILKYLQENSGR